MLSLRALPIVWIFLIMLGNPIPAVSETNEAWVRYRIDFPGGVSGTSTVEFVFTAKYFTEPEKADGLLLENRKLSEMQSEELFLKEIIRRNASGTREEILQLWLADERKMLERNMESEPAFERNAALFRNMVTTSLLSVIKYKEYYLFCVEHNIKGIGLYRKVYPAVRIEESYFMTNKLMGDVFYEKILASLLPFLVEAKEVN